MTDRQEEARRFLFIIDPGATTFTFQTFDDNIERVKEYKAANNGYPDPAMTRLMHGTLEEHWSELERMNDRGAGIFVTINETDGLGRQIGNITRVRALYIDLDGSPLEPVLEFGYPPHLVVDTSPGKWHAYWLIDFIPLDEFSALQKMFIQRFKSDKSIFDLPRVMRVPGFYHRKAEPSMVVIHMTSDIEVYSGDIFRQELLAKPADDISVVGAGVQPDENDIDGIALKNLSAWVPRLFGDKARPYHKGYRISSRSLGRDNEEDLSIQPTGIKDFGVHDLGDDKSGKRLPTGLVMEFGGAENKFDAECWLCSCMGIPQPTKRRTVVVKLGQLAITADLAQKSLLEAGVSIYQRANTMVRPIVDNAEAAHGRKSKTASLRIINPDYLRDLLSRHTQFAKYNAKNKLINCDPPMEVVNTMIARVGEYPFPNIAGVITTPTLRPDGSLLIEPGYDTSTQLLLVEPPDMPAIADHPTKKDALAALELLKGLLVEFPLVDGIAKSVALAAMITPVVRGAFPVSPMFAARAPVAGTGKSYLWDLVAAIAIGQLMPVMAAGRTEEETEKRLGASLLTGQPLISIDNVNGVLGGDALAQMVERPVIDIRILGKSEKMRVEASGTTLFCTGNNIVLKGDLVRRTLTATLNPGIERPEQRQFDGTPVKAVIADRGKYVAACLTICRAHLMAKNGSSSRLASFEGWSDMVASALVWLGEENPQLSIEKAREEDPVTSVLREVLVTWGATMGIGSEFRLTATEMGLRVNETDPTSRELRWPNLYAAIRNAASARNGNIDLMRFNYWLRDFQERIVDGLCLKSKMNARHSKEWWVESSPVTVVAGTYSAWSNAGDRRFGVVDGGRRPPDDEPTPF